MRDPSFVPLREHVRLVYGLFVAAAVASFAYCLVMGQFNGDFFPQPVFLSVRSLVVVLMASLVPYAITLKIADAIDRFPPHRVFEPSPNALLLLLLAGFGAHIAATLFYGVGVLDSQVYSAPPQIVPLIQVLNRLDPFYLGAFFIFATRKRLSTDLLAITLMVGTGVLRAGLGGFIYVLISMGIKYRLEVLGLFRRMPWLVIGTALALPTIVSTLYEIRGQLRGDTPYDYSLSEMMLGRFVGRLSSFSNVAFIAQNKESFEWASSALEPLYYLKQGLSSLLGSGFLPRITPERLLISGTRNYEGYSNFMAGIPGNLFMAWHVSPWTAALNLTMIVGSVVAILWLSRYFGRGVARAFGLGMIVYPLTSGVANEFAMLLLNTLSFLVFAMVVSVRTPRVEPARGG